MSDQTVPIVLAETPVPEEKKFHLNRKMVGGIVAGTLATVAAAFAITRLGKDSDSEENEDSTEVYETFTDTDTTVA